MWSRYDEPERKRLQERLQESGAQKVYSLGDVRLYECPLTWITGDTSDIMRLISLCHDSGVLVVAGGWADQPAWFAEAYDIYRQELAKWQKEVSQSR